MEGPQRVGAWRMVIYKVLLPSEWAQFQADGVFRGTPNDMDFGFIHAAFAAQYQSVIDKHYAGVRPLVLISIEADNLPEGDLVVEANRPGGAEYPHIYAPIALDVVASVREIQ